MEGEGNMPNKSMYPTIFQDTKIRKPGKNKCPPTTLDITHIRIQSKFHKSGGWGQRNGKLFIASGIRNANSWLCNS